MSENNARKIADYDEIFELATPIAESTFNFYIKKINEEMQLVLEKYDDIRSTEFLEMILRSLSSIDYNVLRWMKNCHQNITNKKIEFSMLMLEHINLLLSMASEEEQKKIREKLNETKYNV